MSEISAAPEQVPVPIASRFLIRVFYAFAALAALSVVISVAGKWLGASIASVDHTDDTTVREIVIGNNVMAVPANYIRFPKARIDGEAHRLELYMRWPDMAGYSNAARDDFNNRDGSRRILFMSLEPQQMSRDMSGRLEPIYRRLIELPGAQGPSGLRVYRFSKDSGYMNEVLLVGERPGEEPFVTRCLNGPVADDSLAACERDVHIGDELSLTYRFPQAMLTDWRKLDTSVMAKMREFLRTTP